MASAQDTPGEANRSIHSAASTPSQARSIRISAALTTSGRSTGVSWASASYSTATP